MHALQTSFFACMLACRLVGFMFHCLSMHAMYCRLSKTCASASAISSLGILQGSPTTQHPEPAKILQRRFGSKRVECCKHAANPWTTRFVKQGRLNSCLPNHIQALSATGKLQHKQWVMRKTTAHATNKLRNYSDSGTSPSSANCCNVMNSLDGIGCWHSS